MKRTFLDSGVLVAAVRQDHPFDDRIDRLLLDPERVFLSSAFVRLKVLPKAVFHERADHVTWFELFFDSLAGWADAIPALIAQAEETGANYGLNALDALHVASAIALGADVLVTTERPTKPIHRPTVVAIVTLSGKGLPASPSAPRRAFAVPGVPPLPPRQERGVEGQGASSGAPTCRRGCYPPYVARKEATKAGVSPRISLANS